MEVVVKVISSLSVGSVFAFVFVAVGCASEATGPSEPAPVSSEADALKVDCSYVKCAMPLCGPRQHLSQQGCCPVCVGPDDKCATVLCAAVECPAGEVRVTKGGDCCGRCVPLSNTPECNDDLDCPQYQCIACPCPVSSCVGRRCVTTTPDASTCGSSL